MAATMFAKSERERSFEYIKIKQTEMNTKHVKGDRETNMEREKYIADFIKLKKHGYMSKIF